MLTAHYARILATGHCDRLYDLARTKIEAAARGGHLTCTLILEHRNHPVKNHETLIKHLVKRGYEVHVTKGEVNSAIQIRWEKKTALPKPVRELTKFEENWIKFFKLFGLYH